MSACLITLVLLGLNRFDLASVVWSCAWQLAGAGLSESDHFLLLFFFHFCPKPYQLYHVLDCCFEQVSASLAAIFPSVQ